MHKEWLTKYYRSLGWSEHRISRFLERAERGEVMKSKEAKRVLGAIKQND